MNFKEYDEIIKNHKYDMLFLGIYYNLQFNDNFKNYNDDDIKKLIYMVHSAYLKDENYNDLGLICDVAIENADVILNNKDFTKWDLLNLCYERSC